MFTKFFGDISFRLVVLPVSPLASEGLMAGAVSAVGVVAEAAAARSVFDLSFLLFLPFFFSPPPLPLLPLEINLIYHCWQ